MIFACCAKFARDSFALFDGEDAIDSGQTDVFDCTAGPVNFELVDSVRVTESKMDALIV